MPKLKNYSNIRTLGYVATNYTNKPIDSLVAEIHTYAIWSQLLNDTRVAVDGIFFDETPGPYDWKAHDYLALATQEVKGSPGLGQRVVGRLIRPREILSFVSQMLSDSSNLKLAGGASF